MNHPITPELIKEFVVETIKANDSDFYFADLNNIKNVDLFVNRKMMIFHNELMGIEYDKDILDIIDGTYK